MMDYNEYFEIVYNVCANVFHSVGDYKDKAGKAYEKILKNLTEKGFSKAEISKLTSEQEVSRIFCEVEELSEAGYNIDKQSVALFKFYQSLCNKVSGKNVNLKRVIFEASGTLVKPQNSLRCLE